MRTLAFISLGVIIILALWGLAVYDSGSEVSVANGVYKDGKKPLFKSCYVTEVMEHGEWVKLKEPLAVVATDVFCSVGGKWGGIGLTARKGERYEYEHRDILNFEIGLFIINGTMYRCRKE